jgi:hypothetical protein
VHSAKSILIDELNYSTGFFVPYETSFLQFLLVLSTMITFRFLLLTYLVADVRVEPKECLCPQKENWPVPYNSQMFCGKELMKLSPKSDCKSEMKYLCKRQQIIAIGKFHCEKDEDKFCSPVLERHCHPYNDDKRIFETCMKGRACVISEWADANMKAFYENISKSQ